MFGLIILFSRTKYHCSDIPFLPPPTTRVHTKIIVREGSPISVCAHGWSYFAGGPRTTEAPLSALCALRFLHCELLSAVLRLLLFLACFRSCFIFLVLPIHCTDVIGVKCHATKCTVHPTLLALLLCQPWTKYYS